MLEGASLADLAKEFVTKPKPIADKEIMEKREESYARRLGNFVQTFSSMGDNQIEDEVARMRTERAERLRILRLKFKLQGYMGVTPDGAPTLADTRKSEIAGYKNAARAMIIGGPRRRTVGIINRISEEWRRDRPKRRAAHLAYGLLLGKPYAWMEHAQTNTLPDFGRVAMEARRTMLDKKSTDTVAQQRLEQRIHEWLQTAYAVPHIAALIAARDGAQRAQVEA